MKHSRFADVVGPCGQENFQKEPWVGFLMILLARKLKNKKTPFDEICMFGGHSKCVYYGYSSGVMTDKAHVPLPLKQGVWGAKPPQENGEVWAVASPPVDRTLMRLNLFFSAWPKIPNFIHPESWKAAAYMHTHVLTYIRTYVHTCICMCVYIYIYV